VFLSSAKQIVRFGILSSMTMKITVVCDVSPCSLVVTLVTSSLLLDLTGVGDTARSLSSRRHRSRDHGEY
jgi:hypothetical protein